LNASFDFDLAVIGSGPGGYVAAIRASQLGLKTVIFEKEKVGGVCLNVGCIPSKALIYQAEIYRSIAQLEKMGIKVDLSQLEYKKVFNSSRKAADTLSRGVQFLLKKNNIQLVASRAKIAGKNEIQLESGEKISAKNILIATGSRPKELATFPINEKNILSSTGALMLNELPKSMAILGAGAIGVEFAHIFNSFGVQITLIEALDNILPLEDSEAVEVLKSSFKKRGIKILTKTLAHTVQDSGNILKITLESKEDPSVREIEAEQLLVAVGRVPNSEDIGLENIGLTTEKGFIPVGDYYQTQIPGVYAIGDVINTPLLAHVASKEGEIAVSHMAGIMEEKKIDEMLIPSCIYCEPQIASFGYREENLIKESIPYAKATFPFRGSGKAIAIEKPEGFVKVLYKKETKEILGAHLVGAEATELIHEILLAKKTELLPRDIANTMHAHPTLSETLMETMREIEGWAIHK
jgi:dihydrolipoamide dehydrogenase